MFQITSGFEQIVREEDGKELMRCERCVSKRIIISLCVSILIHSTRLKERETYDLFKRKRRGWNQRPLE